ncbi:DUF11 domain-containing protein [Variovorax sp. Root473]|uniref:DUF11 domain-containing protein n=1 Tax=Variovorax sp. Root473 TaxID=1736541 RepID=UPI0009E7EE61|nr:DUF11 domain-containing protein [Variovorax sp. Root473]
MSKKSLNGYLRGAFFFCASLGFLNVAFAQPAATAKVVEPSKNVAAKEVAVLLTQHKVVGHPGEERLQDAATIKPGDLIEYRATYTNNTGKSVAGLTATLPIPEGLEYTPRSAKPGAGLAQAATKDGVFGNEPLERKLPGGKTEPVPYSEYRTFRWSLGSLPANGSTAVTVRAKVEMVAQPAPAEPAASRSR